MSFTSTRGDLATALSTVEGITGYPKRPKTLSTGVGWALLDNAERGPGAAFAATWRVLVVLGGDEMVAYDKADELLPPLVDAIDPVAFVDSARPIAIQTSSGELFALEITARSE